MLTVYIKLTNRKSYFIFSGVFLFGLFLIVDLQRMTEGYYWNVSQLTFHQKHTFTSLIILILFDFVCSTHLNNFVCHSHLLNNLCCSTHLTEKNIYSPPSSSSSISWTASSNYCVSYIFAFTCLIHADLC